MSPMWPRARSSDPWTSHAAAHSVSNVFVRASQQAVLRVLRQQGPMHDQRIIHHVKASGFKASNSGIRSRRSELVFLGLVRNSGKTVRLSSGRNSIIWELVPNAINLADQFDEYGLGN